MRLKPPLTCVNPMTCRTQHVDRSLQGSSVNKDVVGVVGRDNKHADVDIGQRFGQSRHNSNHGEIQRTNNLKGPPIRLNLDVFTSRRLILDTYDGNLVFGPGSREKRGSR